MKKKLLFVIPEFSHGGTNKSLENLLHFIDKNKYDVSIYSLYEDGGDYYKNIFSQYILKKSLLYHLTHDNQVTRKVMGILMKLSNSINFNWLYNREAKILQKKYNFDTVIAFQEGASTLFTSFFEKPRTIAWIHYDYAVREGFQGSSHERKLYSKYDKIVCVSNAALHSFVKVYPEFSKKSTFIYNTINTDAIIAASLESFDNPFHNDCFNILSIGRFVGVKQFLHIPEIAAKIKSMTDKRFCWYIIGDGEHYCDVETKIKELQLEDEVKLLGAKDNPYPYIAHAHLHICTSRSESFSYTIAESKILHVPVLTNDFPVSAEVISESEGWICNIKNMPQLLTGIIENKDDIYAIKRKKICSYSYDNAHMMACFSEII